MGYKLSNQYLYNIKKNNDETYQLKYIGTEYNYERTTSKEEVIKILKEQQGSNVNIAIVNAKLIKRGNNYSVKILKYSNDSATRKEYINKLRKIIYLSIDYNVISSDDLKKIYNEVCKEIKINTDLKTNELYNKCNDIENYINKVNKLEVGSYSIEDIKNHINISKNNIDNLRQYIKDEEGYIYRISYRLENGAYIYIRFDVNTSNSSNNKLNKIKTLNDELLNKKIFNNKDYKKLYLNNMTKMLLADAMHTNNELCVINAQSEKLYKDIIKDFVVQNIDNLLKYDYATNEDISSYNGIKKLLHKFSSSLSDIIEKHIKNSNIKLMSLQDILDKVNNIRGNVTDNYKLATIKWKVKKHHTGYYEDAKRSEITVEFKEVANQNESIMTYECKEYRYIGTGICDIELNSIVAIKFNTKYYILYCDKTTVEKVSIHEHEIRFIQEEIIDRLNRLEIKINKTKLHMALSFFGFDDSKIDNIWGAYSNKIKDSKKKADLRI